jgi:hypothetical protein
MTPPYVQSVIILGERKSVGLALVLGFIFGPLGLLYASVVGGIVMFFVSGVVGLLTLGFGLLLIWPICAVWAVLAVNRHNAKLTAQVVATQQR